MPEPLSSAKIDSNLAKFAQISQWQRLNDYDIFYERHSESPKGTSPSAYEFPFLKNPFTPQKT
jgi:hypothetical protein